MESFQGCRRENIPTEDLCIKCDICRIKGYHLDMKISLPHISPSINPLPTLQPLGSHASRDRTTCCTHSNFSGMFVLDRSMEFRIDFKETGIWAGSNTNFSIMAFHKRTKLSCCFCGTTTGSEEEQWRLCFFFFGRVPVKPSLLNLSNKQGSVVFQHVGWKDGPAGLGGGTNMEISPDTSACSLSSLLWFGLFYVLSSPPDWWIPAGYNHQLGAGHHFWKPYCSLWFHQSWMAISVGFIFISHIFTKQSLQW